MKQHLSIPRPQEGEYPPYAIDYINEVPEDGRVLDHLATSFETVKALVESLPENKLSTPFAEGEWTVKEILLHMMDTERIFAYRVLRFARNDPTPQPGFDQDIYVPYSRAHERSLEDILAEYAAMRAGTLALYESLQEADLLRPGTASNYPVTVRGVIYMTLGHESHHLKSIRQNYG